MKFYAAIKRLKPKDRNIAMIQAIAELSLVPYVNVQSGKLSGGNKRKLSVAIAMLGSPPILLLDEPSTGMDPEARRFMWSVISNVSTKMKQSTVIISTHSMEEAEALASKIGIMVAGKFRCIGSSQHIKSKYGQGYEIYIRATQPTKEEIKECCAHYGYTIESRLYIDNIKEFMLKCGMSALVEEIKKGGYASEFFSETEAGRSVRAEYVASLILIEKIGLKIDEELIAMYDDYEQLEHVFTTYKYKVPRTKSLAEIFQLLWSLVCD